MSDPVLILDDISHSYHRGLPTQVDVLRGASLEMGPGELIALVAPSGAGKSTLLHVAGLLDRQDSGSVSIKGQDTWNLSDDKRTGIRRDTVGFVYQFHHLLPEFSAVENVVLPQLANAVPERDAIDYARQLLDTVGLGHRYDHRPAELSGGEQQRVAFCRALANRPAILLADEPTGNLDPTTSDQVFDALLTLVRETGLSALIATHNAELAARMDRTVKLEEGVLVSV
ncbi:ABC transporter ATP-binding protein [Qingshengfaniella alkalisoli]|uniref:ABC transporter ATP-binding protein n=1 Tax=Qingshengfaniella alkalisoli TaxID=2599296 RepID=A0A5B8IXD3_9RHOB|nr:ABC transporter ATP-binding protein [Qingshengfaniella alkalisoli]QDY69561.1 ABC transporter ATP-binding protein [Qingshengfaniella alkalisoli]